MRIAAPVVLGVLRLNALMLQAMEEFPLLQIELMLEDRFADPTEERIDLTLRIGGALPLDLAAHPLAVWPRYLVAAPDYVARRGRPKHPRDLPRHEYLRYAGNDDTVVLSRRAESVRDGGVPAAARTQLVNARLRAWCAAACRSGG